MTMKLQDPTMDLSERDDQDVTPLHWAAINAHMATCRWLLDEGADVDAIGGDLKATPLQWAARNGHLYVIQLLLSRGADPNISDAQGFNSLHLITHSSAVMPLLYMVSPRIPRATVTILTGQMHQPVAIDEKDTDGHTSLMWAAYQGEAALIVVWPNILTLVRGRSLGRSTPPPWRLGADTGQRGHDAAALGSSQGLEGIHQASDRGGGRSRRKGRPRQDAEGYGRGAQGLGTLRQGYGGGWIHELGCTAFRQIQRGESIHHTYMA